MYLWTCAPSEDSDQTAHSRSLIRIFTGRILDRQGCKVSSCGQRRLWSDCKDAQAELSLRWTHNVRKGSYLILRFICVKSVYMFFAFDSFQKKRVYSYCIFFFFFAWHFIQKKWICNFCHDTMQNLLFWQLVCTTLYSLHWFKKKKSIIFIVPIVKIIYIYKESRLQAWVLKRKELKSVENSKYIFFYAIFNNSFQYWNGLSQTTFWLQILY